jgi:hypothetical protein
MPRGWTIAMFLTLPVLSIYDNQPDHTPETPGAGVIRRMSLPDPLTGFQKRLDLIQP